MKALQVPLERKKAIEEASKYFRMISITDVNDVKTWVFDFQAL